MNRVTAMLAAIWVASAMLGRRARRALRRALPLTLAGLWLALSTSTPAAAVPAAAVVSFFAAVGVSVSATVAAVVAFVVNTAISIAINAAASKLFGPKTASSAQERQASVLSLSLGEGPREAIFGRAATGGRLLDAFNFGGTNRTDWEVLVIKVADHKCDALEGFILGDTFYAFSADGVQAGFNNQLEVYWKNGDPAQTASSYLVTNSASRLYGTAWTTNDVCASQAYVVVAYKADAPNAPSPVWPQGRPQFKFVVRGKLCYDPRKDSTVAGGSGAHRWATPSTWEWSENAAICDYNYDRGIYAKDQVSDPKALLIGRGLSALEADPARVAARANVCDENVTLKAGGTEKRYRVGGVVFASETFEDVKQKFADAMAGDIVKRNGGVEVLPGVAQSTVAEITDQNLLLGQPVSYEPFLSDNDRVNMVTAHYNDPAQLYKNIAAPVRRNDTDVINDGGQKTADVPLDLVTSGTQAQRIAEIKRRLARKERRAAIPLPPTFSHLEDGDWVGWTSDRYFGGGRMVMRVEAYTVSGTYDTNLVLREIGSDAYSWTAATDESTPGQAPVNSAPTAAALALVSPTLAAHALTGASSAVFPAVKATWATPVDSAIRAVVLEIRKVGSTDVAQTRLDRPNDGIIITTDGVPSGVSVEARLVPVPFDPTRTATPTGWATITASSFSIIAAGITGQGQLATLNVVDGVHLAAAQGTNAIVDAGFRFQTTYWTNIASGAGTWATSVGTSGGLRYLQRAATGTPGAGVSNSMGQGFHPGLLPCKPGDRIEASAYLAGSGVATADLVVEWFNAAGVYIGGASVQTLTGAPANTNFSAGTAGQTRLAGFATAPASAAYAEICAVWTTTAAASPLLMMALPLIRQANSGQTEVTPWSPGVEAQLGADITGSNTAAGIAGQGALATLNQATWATQVTGTGKPDDFANKALVYRQSSAPSSPSVNDIWVKLNGGGTQEAIYAWNGSVWILGSDVTGLFTAAAIAGQGALATLNVVGAVQLAASQGANAIVDAGFRFLSSYWQNVTSSAGTWTSSTGTTGNVRFFQRQATGTPGAGVSNSMGQGFHPGLLPCKPGDRIEGSAYVAGSGVASVAVVIEWFNASGAFLGNTQVASLSGAPAGGTFSGGIAGQTRLGGFATAPASAVYAELLVVWTTTGASGPLLQVGLPLIRQANSGQTDITPWMPGVEAQLGADITGSNTAAGISGQGGFATANYYRQSSDPGAVAAGSIWVDTSGAYEIVKQRIGGVWVTIANNASAGAVFNVTLSVDQLNTVGPGTAGTISSAVVTATPHNNVGAVTYQWLKVASDPAGHTINISAPTSAATQFSATVNVSNEPYGTFMCVATDSSGAKAQVQLPVAFYF